jgi:hypothetical protein
MMRWYGRLTCNERWDKCSKRLFNGLISHWLPHALGTTTTTVRIRMPTTTQRTDGPDGYWELSSMELHAGDIEWMGSMPREDSVRFLHDGGASLIVRLTAHRQDGEPVAGVCFLPNGIFSFEEIEHALWSHFGAGNARQTPMSLMCSSEKPVPILLPRCPIASHRELSVFQCENPGCPGFRRPVLVPARNDYLSGNRVGAVAYPCPRCTGQWYDRWALTWMRQAELIDLMKEPFVQFPVAPTEQRRNVLAGPMSTTVQVARSEEPWGWHPRNIRRLPRSFRSFLRTSKQSDLVAAMRKEPDMVGDILQAILQRGNLRALVDYVRSMPVKKRLNGIPRALGHAFCPKRPSAYRVSQESIQTSHHFYIAYSPDLFMGFMDYYGVADCRGAFLDVGSGIGEKPFIAYACGQFDRCDGLEYDPRTLAVAQFLLNQIQTDYRYPITYELGDALQFVRYGDYDVIYMYRPMRDKAMMRQLFLKIGADMKIGATCMDVIEKDLAFRRVGVDKYASVSDVDSQRRAVWGKTQSLEDFLEAMGFPAPESY